ncbi:MAG TPA: histidine--tRNA ligase [Acidimicrobiales bacterium]
MSPRSSREWHENGVRANETVPLGSDPIAEADIFRAPKGTRDVVAPESRRWTALVARFAQHVERAGYGLHIPPMFEHYEVLARVGESTDIVQKEMYEFEDRGGRRLALRPEGTASVMRAYVEHRPTLPWKVWYVAPNFRAEAPQAGRYRQHHQVGVEAIGTLDPDLDVEVISLLDGFFRDLGLRGYRLRLNSLGDPTSRSQYLEALRAHFDAHAGDLSAQARQTATVNPLRVLDSKREQDAGVIAGAPRMVDYLSDDAGAHFERVQSGLRAVGVAYEMAPLLVRGLDYYTRTTFEFAADSLGAAQNGIGGGGRYDGLAEQMGAPATPGIGFGSGIERTLMACDAEGVFAASTSAVDVFVIDVVDGTHALVLTTELRRAGVRADRAFDQRSMKAQMKQADRSGAAIALIVGEQEAADGTVTLRRMADATQETIPREKVVDAVREGLNR